MEDETTMAQEDQTQNCSNGSGCGGGGGRSSKKPNKKPKVPQRGLGVAQLEKIRLEEQQKKNAAAILQPPPQSSVSSTKSSYVPLTIQNFHHSNHQYSSPVPLPCGGSPVDFMTPLPLQHMDAKAPPSTVPLANTSGGGGGGGFEAGWPAVAVLPRHGNVPKLWNSHEFDLEKERFGVDPGLPFLPCLSYESNPIWPLPNLMQRTTQYHQPSSSMVIRFVFEV